jgi:diguanylate cyclase (GGDEF)-like protein
MISFKRYLALWLGGLALAVLLLVGLYGGYLTTQAVREAAGETLHSGARNAADLLGANLRERELEVLILSQAPHLVEGPLDSAAVKGSLDLRKRLRSEYAWLGLADAEGQVRAATEGMLVGVSVAARDWFKAAAQSPFLGDVHEAKLLAKLLPAPAYGEPLRFIDFAAPVIGRDGQLRGVIGTHAHWSWVTSTVVDTVKRSGLAASAEVLILDRDGRVLYPERAVGQLALKTAMPEGQHHAVLAWTDGDDYLTSQAELETGTAAKLGWRIVLRQPLDTALAPVRALALRLSGIGLLAALACAGIAYLLAARIAAPVNALAATARRIEQGEIGAEFPPLQGPRELQVLEGAVRAMTESLLRKEQQLAAANATLEAAVLQRTEALEAANAELARMATRDALTGVFNRRWFDEKLLECIHVARRTGQSFALLLIDADHFKQVNDRHGHGVGDAVLKRLADLLVEHTRATDCVARFGGEEFALLMPGNSIAVDALVVAEKLRAAVAAADFPVIGRLTISGGVSLWSSQDEDLGALLLQRADTALYRAKANGRDRVDMELLPTPSQYAGL